jgi:drug/metabolite transporter (DMT)-like permease
MISEPIGILLALSAAFIWGTSDFSGGMATRRSGPYAVVALSALAGILPLIVCALLWREPFPTTRSLLYALAGGASGAIGLAALYYALTLGVTATVAPTSAVLGAVLPVMFGMFTEGLPGPTRILGFTLAVPGLWLVSRPADGERQDHQQTGLLLALLAGTCFGLFFIMISQVEPGSVFIPLIASRLMTLAGGMIMLLTRRTGLSSLAKVFTQPNPVAVVAGLLDAFGNVFYLLARHQTRLDVATMLASLYPAGTVILAQIVLKEKASKVQWAGAAFCLSAVALIALS